MFCKKYARDALVMGSLCVVDKCFSDNCFISGLHVAVRISGLLEKRVVIYGIRRFRSVCLKKRKNMHYQFC